MHTSQLVGFSAHLIQRVADNSNKDLFYKKEWAKDKEDSR